MKAFTAIRGTLPGVPVFVVPYPELITRTGCKDSVLLDDEHAFVSEFITALNERVRVSAANAGVHYFGNGLFGFAGSGICEGEVEHSSMNVANLNPVGGGLLDRITPTNWLHGSLHPTPAGHRRIAEMLDAVLPDDPRAIPPNPGPDKDAAFHLRNVGGARPALYNPEGLSRPAGIACPIGAPTLPFAARALVFDARLPIVIDADPSEVVCYTGPDGSWKADRPGADGVVTLVEDVVGVPAHPLGSRNAPQEQRIVYRDREGNWRLRLVSFCKTTPGCADTQGEFIKQQLGDSARELAVPVLLIFAGAWLATVGSAGFLGRLVVRARDAE